MNADEAEFLRLEKLKNVKHMSYLESTTKGASIVSVRAPS